MANISNITLPDNTNHGIRAGAIPYGEVDATSTATAFTATVPGIMELTDGTTVMLRNGQITSASGFTLNINGLGAKPCYNNMATGNDRADPPTAATRDTTIFNVVFTMLFVYSTTVTDGGGWICYRGYDANTVGYQLRTNSGNLPAIEAGYRYRIWLTALDGLHWVPINTSTSTDATTSRSLNTRVIDPFGPIVYNSTNGTVAKDARPAVTTLWQQYTLTIGYSYVKTLTAWKPVYLKCTPQSGGGVVMNDIVQALPTSEDGKVYIYLGQAYSTTAMELRAEHPVYYYKDGAIRLWSNAESATIPSVTQSATTGISIDNHATGTVTGVQSTTTTASKVTLGTAFSVPNVTSAGSASTWTFEEKSIPNVTSAGSASTWTFEEKTIPNVTSAGSASTWTFEEKTIPNVTAAGSGSYTQGSFSGGSFTQGTDSFTANTPTVINTSKFSGGSYSHSGFNGGSFTRGTFSGGSLTMAMDATDTKKLNITFTAATHANDSFTAATYGTDSFTAASLQTGFYTAGTAASFTQGEDEFTPATHGADSHTHTAPTIGTAIKVQSKSGGGNGTAPTLGTAIKVQSKSGGANGSAPTLGTAIKVQSKSGGANGSAPTLGTAFSIPNVTGATDVIVPIKNTSASTFVTGTTHTITDNGHTHSI